MNGNKLAWWIVGGAIVGIVIIYLAISGAIKIPSGVRTAEETGPLATATSQGIVAAPGLSPVSKEGQVVNKNTGAPVKLDVTPGSPDAPQQSDPIALRDAPTNSIKISMSAEGIAPSTFRVKRGEVVTLTLTATDNQTHVFAFEDSSLSAVAVGLAPGETRVTAFNAPSARGEYQFYCNVPGHATRGETGTMIVE
ncbi:MAG: cupredoxin domain-containing protein [Candidatus Brennerbacteria bacterium]|nr:cupredoxin domain-containing protein [Candidatus Brennerbacteria bacterium]